MAQWALGEERAHVSFLPLIMRLAGGRGDGGRRGRTAKEGRWTCWLAGCLTPLAWNIQLCKAGNMFAHLDPHRCCCSTPRVIPHLEDSRQYWRQYRLTWRTHIRFLLGIAKWVWPAFDFPWSFVNPVMSHVSSSQHTADTVTETKHILHLTLSPRSRVHKETVYCE